MFNLKSVEFNSNNKTFQEKLVGFSKMLTQAIFVVASSFFLTSASNAYPIFAQQNYANPREANGRIVCANCHLAEKPVEIEVPQAVLPDTVFEAVVKIPYDKQVKQVLGNGQKGGLNVGAVVILPEGFKLAPKARLDEELKAKIASSLLVCITDIFLQNIELAFKKYPLIKGFTFGEINYYNNENLIKLREEVVKNKNRNETSRRFFILRKYENHFNFKVLSPVK